MTIDKRKPEDLDTQGNDHACLAGDTLVMTDSGPLPIKDLCGNYSVAVLSHDGYYHEACGALTRKQANVIKLVFNDNSEIVCTPDHKFRLVNGTFKTAIALTSADLIDCVTYGSRGYFGHVPTIRRNPLLSLRQLLFSPAKRCAWLKTLAQKGLGILQWCNSKRYAHSSQGRQQSQQSDRKLRIIRLQDSLVQSHDARAEGVGKNQCNQQSCTNGEVLAQVATGSGMAFRTCQANSSQYAVNYQNLRVLPGGVSNKKEHGVESQVLSSKLQNVSKAKTVKSKSYFEAPQDVYCLNVPKTSTYVLGNGVVSHNCDAL